MTPACGKQFADFIPGSKFELVGGACHFPQIERTETAQWPFATLSERPQQAGPWNCSRRRPQKQVKVVACPRNHAAARWATLICDPLRHAIRPDTCRRPREVTRIILTRKIEQR